MRMSSQQVQQPNLSPPHRELSLSAPTQVVLAWLVTHSAEADPLNHVLYSQFKGAMLGNDVIVLPLGKSSAGYQSGPAKCLAVASAMYNADPLDMQTCRPQSQPPMATM